MFDVMEIRVDCFGRMSEGYLLAYALDRFALKSLSKPRIDRLITLKTG